MGVTLLRNRTLGNPVVRALIQMVRKTADGDSIETESAGTQYPSEGAACDTVDSRQPTAAKSMSHTHAATNEVHS